MTQTVVQSGTDFFGNTTTATVTLTGVTAGNAIEVRVSIYGNNPAAQGSPSDGVNTYQLAKRQGTAVSGTGTAEIHYAENVAGGNTTVTVTTNAPADYRYGWIWVGEIAGRATSGSLDSAASGGATGTSNSPAVTGAGSTTVANTMLSAVLSIATGTANAGIDAANGNSLTWSNRILKQDVNSEMGMSGDDAPATSTLTPSVNWGTLAGSYKWAAVVAAFKDAEGGTTYNETISEGVTAGESSAASAVANATLTESATAGETSAALVTANASLTETATPGESSAAAATINAGTSEGVTPGDSYASDPATYDETISEGVTLGDSYATDSAAVPSGGRRRPRREPQWELPRIRPEDLPAVEASILIRQPSQTFSLGVEVSTAVDIEMEQGLGPMELAAETGDEVAIEMQAAAQFIDALLTTVPMRKEPAPTFAKLAPMLVRIEIEQAEQIEYEIA
jgi:hypothetical protein